MDLAKIAPLVVAGLGVLNFIWGFLPSFGTEPGMPDSVPTSVYATGPGYLPILLLFAGLLALGAVLPKPARVVFPTAALTLAATIGVLVVGFITGGTVDLIASVGQGSGPSKGIGLILLLIFAIVQTIAAVGWWLIDAGIVNSSGAAGGGAGAAGPHPANPPSGGMPAAAPSGPWPGAGPAGPPPGDPGPRGPVGPPPGTPDFGVPGHQPGPSGHQPGPSGHQPGPSGEQPGPGMDRPGPFGAPPSAGGPSSGPTPAVGQHDEPGGAQGFGPPPAGPGFDPAPGAGQPPAPDAGPGRPEPPAVPGSGDDDNPEETQQLRF